MKIFLAADHRGFQLKESLKQFLVSAGYDVADAGDAKYDESDDYVDFANSAAEHISQDPAHARGIFVCGSGVGMDVVANKHRGVRAALAHDEHEARQSREHGDSNVLVLGADEMDAARAGELAKIFLETPFSGEDRHIRRLAKIAEIEEQNFK